MLFRSADSMTDYFAGRATVLDAARRFDSGEDTKVGPSAAKYFASEMVCRVADRAVQIHGGAGYMRGVPVERFYRDARLFRIYEGTSQIQQVIIARALLGDAAKGLQRGVMPATSWWRPGAWLTVVTASLLLSRTKGWFYAAAPRLQPSRWSKASPDRRVAMLATATSMFARRPSLMATLIAYALLTYAYFMAMTTIRVEAEVRDRLAARAVTHGRSLGAELRAMLDEMMWQGIEAGYQRLAANQDEMAEYQAEAAEWTSAGVGDLAATAAEEYPEYNS